MLGPRGTDSWHARLFAVRVAALNAARTFVKKVAGGPGAGGEGQLKALIGKVLENTEDLKYSQVG